MSQKWVSISRSSLASIAPAIFSIIAAFLIGGILLLLSGNDPIFAYTTLLKGAFGSSHRFAETLVKATPLMVLALGISIAFKNQIWNIGGDGQFTMGAIFATFVAINLSLPNILLFPITFLAAFAGGAFFGGIVGYLRAKFNANEVITTLMMNYIAIYFLSYLVKGPMMDPAGHGFPQTELIDTSLILPILLQGTRLHIGLILALIIIVLGFFFWRSVLGFKIQIAGESREVAQYSGINVSRTIVITMVISAGLAGIAGWIEIFGLHYRLLEGIAGGYGTLAIVVALLANLNPLGIIVSSFFFSALLVGGSTMQRLAGGPFSLVDIILGLTIIFVISRVVITNWRDRIAG